MDVLNLFDFDATDGNAFAHNRDVSSTHLQLVANLARASAESDLSAAFEAFTTLRYTNASAKLLATPGNALKIAIDRMDERMVAYLLSEGVCVVADDVRAATLSRVKPIIRLILEHGWPVNAKLGWYDPPVLAYATEDLELTRWFLSQNADPDARCGIDKTPLSIAVQKGSVAVIETLFAHGGTINCGQLLHWAASRQKDDRLAVLNLLLKKGAAVNAIMYENDEDSFIQREPFGLGTPLHAAATAGHLDAIQLLLDRGADMSLEDTCGRFPYELARQNGHHLAAEILRPFSD